MRAAAWLVLAAACCCLVLRAKAQTNYKSLTSFTFTNPGPGQPSPLCRGSDGFLYGSTAAGGTSNLGTLFQLSTDGSSFSLLLSFSTTNGSIPNGRLLEGTDGDLYGTTSQGGSYDSGTVFKLNKNGSGLLLLHEFASNGPDGSRPQAALIQGRDGRLYGTASTTGTAGLGTVFRLNQDGSAFTVLHYFTGPAGGDGSNPFTGVSQGPDGALYGTTGFGGVHGLGTLFKLNTNGSSYVVLHDFAGPDGRPPFGELIVSTNGIIYGTSYLGGTNDYGTVFKMNTDGAAYAVLHHFSADGTGSAPLAGVVQGPDGVLYGTARYGGAVNLGAVFKLRTDGSSYTVLHSFTGSPGDGAQPAAALLAPGDGALYGTTLAGGTNGDGTVFKFFLYTGDTTPPIIAILGSNPLTNECHTVFVDPGATASDNGSGVSSFSTNSTVNPNAVGLYSIQYIATDFAGNSATNTRTVFVRDTTPPIITNCAPAQFLTAGSGGTATLPNLTALLAAGDACNASVRITQSPPAGAQLPMGTNTVRFAVDDGNGNTNHCSTTVTVTAASMGAPIILNQTLLGGGIQLTFTGANGQPYRVLASTDLLLPLINWTALTNGTFAGPVTFIDAAATNYPARYYRIGSP